jgi:hypothetical protein
MREEFRNQVSGISLAILLLSVAASSVQAQANYTIDWFSVDGGAGTSSGGVYSVSGTIGQPDAGKMSGGNYSLEGGFWGIIDEVRTPLLVITRSGADVVVSWTSPSTGFGLEQNPALGTTNWTSVTNSVSDDGTTKSVIVPAGQGNKFYRLKTLLNAFKGFDRGLK